MAIAMTLFHGEISQFKLVALFTQLLTTDYPKQMDDNPSLFS